MHDHRVSDIAPENTTDDTQGISEITKEGREEVWREKPIDPTTMDEYLEQYNEITSVTQDDVNVTLEDTMEAIANTNNSCPGYDGIPFKAYKPQVFLSQKCSMKL